MQSRVTRRGRPSPLLLAVVAAWVGLAVMDAVAFASQIPATFTDDPIVPGRTPIRAVHFAELRTRINALRGEVGLAPFQWTDPVLTAGVTRVRLAHLLELRAAVEAVHGVTGQAAPDWTDAAPEAGTTPIRMVHLTELRAAVVALEAGARTIASLVTSAPSYGPTEAGKRAQERIVVTVADAAGGTVDGARWRIETDDRSGWVYPAQGTTGTNGRIAVTWVAGSPGAGVLALTAENAVSSMTTELATESVASQHPPSSAVAVWMNHDNRADGYSIDLTPLSEPTGTYYAAMQWDGGYAGLQRGGSRYAYQLQFSVWDAPGGGDAEVVEQGEGVTCTPFGGEGTGQKCELNYPWRVGSTYRFEVTEQDLDGGSAMTLHVTDLSSGRRRFVGTLRYAARANLRSFAMFVEDFLRLAPTCLDQSIRSAAIRRVMARIGDAWRPIARGVLDRHEEDAGNPGTPPCANLAARNHAAGLEVVMGGRTASNPDAPSLVTIP